MKNVLLASLALAMLIVGCNKPAENTDSKGGEAAGASASSSFKVALLTPGPVSDSGWNAMAFEGLQSLKNELGAEVNQRESTGTKIRDDMRTYAQEGYNLVIGHGFEYNAPAVEIAKDFPKTAFVSSSGGESLANAGAFRFYLEQGFYLCGYMAGTMSQKKVVAMIGGPDVPSIRSTFKAFRAGAIAANQDVKVIETFTNKDNDISAAKQATLQAIASGADFVIHQANAAAQGVFDACKEKGVYAFGANLDQNNNASGAVIASAVINAGPAFLELGKQVKDGSYKGGILLIGMDKQAIDFTINPAMAGNVPDSLKATLDELKKAMVSGKLVVPKDEF